MQWAIRVLEHSVVGHRDAGPQVDDGQVKVKKGQQVIILRVDEKIVRKIFLLLFTAAMVPSALFFVFRDRLGVVIVAKTLNHVLKFKLSQSGF